MSDPLIIILTLLGIVITVAGAVATGAWVVARAISSGLERVHERIDIQSSASQSRHHATLTRIGQVETELHDVRTEVGHLHDRVGVMERGAQR